MTTGLLALESIRSKFMKFPSMKSNTKLFIPFFTVVIVAIITLAVFPTFAQTTDGNPAATLEQCRNGSVASPAPCGNVASPLGWVAGNSANPQAHWNETEYVPYRLLFSDLPADGTVHTVVLGYDILYRGLHAIDFLGTYNLTETNAMGNDPCFNVTGSHCSPFNPAGTSTSAIPVDPVIVSTFPAPRPTMPTTGVFTMWGGTLGACTYLPYLNTVDRKISCTFTSTVPNPVLSWGGHLAWKGDWGGGSSAGDVSGDPYHMRFESLDGSGSVQDLALNADAVGVTAKLTIIKNAVPITGTTSNVEFDFTADAEFGLSAFTLIDNGILGADRQVSGPIIAFGAANPILVSELFTPGWSLDQVVCIDNLVAPTVNLAARTANITVLEGENVTCTFRNIQLAPSAAPASVNGRVLTLSGRGISKAFVTIFNTTTGESFTSMTNNFGYYRFNDLPVSDFYIMTVSHKRYLFLDASRSFTLEDDMFDVDFISAEEF